MNRLLIVVSLLAFSCRNKEAIGTNPDDEFTWPGGYFVMATTGVDDPCGDGAFAAVLLPEGDDSTTEWQYSIEVPDWDDIETPISEHAIQLQDPFAPMDVTVRRGAIGEIEMAGGEQDRIPFDPDSFADCELDMSVTANLVLDSDTNVHGIAIISILERYGQTCPQFATPCDLTLDFTGEASGG
jgi:hypothetical protein